MFATSGVDDLSVVPESFGSDTVAVFVSWKPDAEDEVIAFGPTETVIVTVLVPPFAVKTPTVAFVQVTACPFALHDHPAVVLVPDTNVKPDGSVSASVTVPVVGPVPLFVSLIV